MLDEVQTAYRVQLWSIVSANALTCLLLSVAVLLIMVRKKYNWFILMLCMLIIADLGIISTNFGSVLEHN